MSLSIPGEKWVETQRSNLLFPFGGPQRGAPTATGFLVSKPDCSFLDKPRAPFKGKYCERVTYGVCPGSTGKVESRRRPKLFGSKKSRKHLRRRPGPRLLEGAVRLAPGDLDKKYRETCPRLKMHFFWRDRSGNPPNWAAFLSTNLKRGPVKAYTQKNRSENPPKSSFSLAFPFPVWLSPKTNKQTNPNQNKQNTQHKHLNTQTNRHADKQNKHCFKSRVYFPVQKSKFPRHNFRHRHHTHRHVYV